MSTGSRRRIVVVGSGAVGSTTAFTLYVRERVDELVLIDSRREKAAGDALDLIQGAPFAGATRVWEGMYEDCKEADIVIITAGTAQRPGETRQDLLERNAGVVAEIVDRVVAQTRDAILLVATNPVDVLTYVALKRSGYDPARVIGSGTLLDSARLRTAIAAKTGRSVEDVHVDVVGEHGDSEVALWSQARMGRSPLAFSEAEQEELLEWTRDTAYRIIAAKGATYYAIALALDRICRAILCDEGVALPVSVLLTGQYNISDVMLGLPAVVGREGIRDIPEIPMNDDERVRLLASAALLRDRIENVRSLCVRQSGS